MGSLRGKLGAGGSLELSLGGPLMLLGTGELLVGILVEAGGRCGDGDRWTLLEGTEDEFLVDADVDVLSRLDDRSDVLIEEGLFIPVCEAVRQRKLEGAARWNADEIDVCRS